MRTDAHQHVWDLAVRDQPWIAGEAMRPLRRSFGLDELALEAAGSGVSRTVLVQTVAEVAETRELLALAALEPLVAGVVGWVDLTDPAVDEHLDALRAGPGGELLVGVRHLAQDEPDPDWLAGAAVTAGLRRLAAAGLCYDLLTRPAQLPAAIRAVDRVPELSFVVDHLSKPDIAGRGWEPWAGGLADLARRDNVACKLSGMVTQASWTDWTSEDLRPYAEHVLGAFGPARVMFGSDWPVCTLAASYREVVEVAADLTSHLDPAEAAQVFGGTATRVYRLVRPGGREAGSAGTARLR